MAETQGNQNFGSIPGCADVSSAAAIKCGDAASVKCFHIWKAVAGTDYRWWEEPRGT